MTYAQRITNEIGIPGQYNVLDLLLQNLSMQRLNSRRIAISTMEGLTFFDIDEIMHLEACSNYTVIHFKDFPKLTVSKTLKDFESMLSDECFFRIHHSHIININYLKKYIKGDGGQIELMNGRVIDVSRRKKEEFLQVIHSISKPSNLNLIKDKLNAELLRLMMGRK
jgi:two-component system, LytTR family, response regulator